MAPQSTRDEVAVLAAAVQDVDLLVLSHGLLVRRDARRGLRCRCGHVARRGLLYSASAALCAVSFGWPLGGGHRAAALAAACLCKSVLAVSRAVALAR